MKTRLILLATLVPAVAFGQSWTPFKPVTGSTKSKSCTDTASAADTLTGNGPSVKITNLGTNKVFVKLGDSTVEAGTSNTVVLANDRQIVNRDPNGETHFSCVTASTETATIFIETGYGG